MSRGPPDVGGLISLKVDNFPFNTTAEDLREMFSKYGDVRDCYIPRDHYTNQSRGFGFIRFATEEEAQDAIDGCDRRVLDGRELRVQVAQHSRPPLPDRGGARFDRRDDPRDRGRDDRGYGRERGYDRGYGYDRRDRDYDRYDRRDRDRRSRRDDEDEDDRRDRSRRSRRDDEDEDDRRDRRSSRRDDDDDRRKKRDESESESDDKRDKRRRKKDESDSEDDRRRSSKDRRRRDDSEED